MSIVLQHGMQELVLDLEFILSLNEMFGMNHVECWERLKEFQFHIILCKYFILNELEFLDVEIKC